MTNDTFNIAGVGEVLWDAFPEGERFGGAPANFACHCKSLGADAHVVSCIGNDERGATARRFLEEHGVGTASLAVSEAHETGVVLVTLDAAGHPDYEIKEGVAWDHIPFTDVMAELCAEVDAVCFGSLSQRNKVSRESIRECLAVTKPDCLRVFDVNLRQTFYGPDVLLPSLEAASAVKLNDDELPIVTEMAGVSGDAEAQLRGLLDRFGLKLAILTCGDRGALMMTPTDSTFREPPKVDVVSTVGAGDAFTAATVMGYLAGRPLDAINRHANAVAGFVCATQGAVPPLPDELRAL